MLAVVGPGAVGGLLAALALRSGQSVVAVARPATAERIAKNGLAIRSVQHGEFHTPVPVSLQIPSGADVILSVKSFGLRDVLPLIADAHPTSVLAVLNGIEHGDILRKTLSAVPVACASITVEVSQLCFGVIEHRSSFSKITVPDFAASWRSVGSLQKAGIEVAYGGTEAEVLWHKFRFLVPVALLTTYYEDSLGAALARDGQCTRDILSEVAAVATAEGITTDPEELTSILTSFPSQMRSSLQHDLEAKGASELDVVGGAVLRRAARHGIAVPRLECIVGDLTARFHTHEPRFSAEKMDAKLSDDGCSIGP